MGKYFPYQPNIYNQYPQYGYSQAPQVPTTSGAKLPSFNNYPQGPSTPTMPGMLPIEQSYIENILRLNKGKVATIYATFENNSEWNAKVFKGAIEAAGRDHVILSDSQTGQRILLPMIYLDYVTFDEEIEYEYPFTNGQIGLSSFNPRKQ